MMKIYYSPSNSGFFHEGIQNNIPLDCIQISKELYESLLSGMSMGMVVTVLGGLPSLSNRALSVNTKEVEDFWVDSEMIRVREELEKVQDFDTEATGSVSEWRSYRKLLRSWRSHEKFPIKEFRPKSPDFKE